MPFVIVMRGTEVLLFCFRNQAADDPVSFPTGADSIETQGKGGSFAAMSASTDAMDARRPFVRFAASIVG